MKIPVVAIAFIFWLITACLAGPAAADAIKESLQRDFPKLKFESVKPSILKGIYEVQAGATIVYYIPESKALVVGQLILSDGRNLTRESELAIISSKIDSIPLDKAVKIGNGKITVVEFSDPECTFSRKAAAFLADKKEVTRFVYFKPHNTISEQKIKYIACSSDRAAAYEEVMQGKVDGKNAAVAACPGGEGDELLKAHNDIVRKVGISGTPVFSINGKVVLGANMAILNKFIEEESKASGAK